MARRLTLELTNTEARALLLSATESRVTVEKSVTVSLISEDSEDKKTSPEQRVVDALSAAGIARLETIAVVGRADVELRLLTIPPSPEEELPNLVRFQATQELPGVDATAPLDYLPLDEAADKPRRVLAAVLKPGIKRRLVTICHDAKLTLVQIVLRSAASASLVVNERPELREGLSLLVEVLGRRVELSAIHGRQVVFLRHVLLSDDPTESDEAAENLVSEIRRTRAVVASQEAGMTVEPIILLGENKSHHALAERLGATIDVPVLLIDPLPGTAVVDSQVDLSLSDRHHATALLGAAMDAAADRRPAFDFLNPHRPPKPPSRRGMYVLIGLVAAAAVIALVALNQIQASAINRSIRDLQHAKSVLKPRADKAEAVIAASEEVDQWLDNEVVWINQLRWLSEQLPPAQDAKLSNLRLFSNERGRAMVLDGLARSGESKASLNRALQDDAHQFVPQSSGDLSEGDYRIKFRSSVHIKPESK